MPATRSSSSASSLEARYLQLYLGEDAVEFPEDGYQGEDIKVRAKEFADLHGDKLCERRPRRSAPQALIDYALPCYMCEGLNVWTCEKYRHPVRCVVLGEASLHDERCCHGCGQAAC